MTIRFIRNAGQEDEPLAGSLYDDSSTFWQVRQRQIWMRLVAERFRIDMHADAGT
jgi:hypothetical protein